MKNFLNKILVLFSLIVVCGCAPDLDPETGNIASADYIYNQPLPTNSPLGVSSLAAENINQAEIVSIVKDILDGRYGGIDSLLIARNNAIVLEQYFNGYYREKKHDIRSATKSIAGLLAGIAIDKGYLASANVTIYDYFTRYDNFEYWSNLKHDITVQHLLTMSAGWECNDWVNSSQGNESTMYRTQDWVKFILDLPMANRPGDIFSYCTGGVGVLGDVIGYSARMDVAEFARINLFDPLDIKNYHFRSDPSNRTHLGGQMHITPLAMLKIGQLFLNNGVWGGEQIVSAAWIAATQSDNFNWYSNLWWKSKITIAATGAEVSYYYASGNGGQKILVLPAYNLTVVFTAHEYNNPAAGNGQWLFVDRIIPALN